MLAPFPSGYPRLRSCHPCGTERCGHMVRHLRLFRPGGGRQSSVRRLLRRIEPQLHPCRIVSGIVGCENQCSCGRETFACGAQNLGAGSGEFMVRRGFRNVRSNLSSHTGQSDQDVHSIIDVYTPLFVGSTISRIDNKYRADLGAAGISNARCLQLQDLRRGRPALMVGYRLSSGPGCDEAETWVLLGQAGAQRRLPAPGADNNAEVLRNAQ